MKITGRKPKLTPEQRKRLHEWAAFGTSKKSVCLRLGIGRATINRYLRGAHKNRVSA